MNKSTLFNQNSELNHWYFFKNYLNMHKNEIKGLFYLNLKHETKKNKPDVRASALH